MASNPLLSYIVSNALADAGLERRGEIVRLTMTMRGGDRPKNAETLFPDVSVMPRSQWEPWVLFRKPLESGLRIQDNLCKWYTYGSNTWAYTRLGRITDKTPAELASLLGDGAVTVTLSMPNENGSTKP